MHATEQRMMVYATDRPIGRLSYFYGSLFLKSIKVKDMPRKKIEFTEEMNFRISQLVETGKSLQEIADVFNNEFETSYVRATISKQVKMLGLERKNNRRMNGKGFQTEFDGFDETQKLTIQLSWGTGATLDEIKTLLKKEFDVVVSRDSIYNLIKKENYVKGKRFTFEYGDTDFGDEEEFDARVREAEEVKATREYPQELLDKMVEDENLIRLSWYEEGELYNYDGQKDTEREGMKDTWYTRDGFLKINTTRVMWFSEGYKDYNTVAGTYRSEWQLQNDVELYTFPSGKDSRGAAIQSKREEIRDWYTENRWIINELYDAIVAKGYINCDEIYQFNKLCGELYAKRMEFINLVLGNRTTTKLIVAGKSKDTSFEDFKGYMLKATGDKETFGDKSE